VSLILGVGCISGPKNSIVKIQDAKKKPRMAGEMMLPTTASYVQLKETAEKIKETAEKQELLPVDSVTAEPESPEQPFA
jgi:hypothetical protein